MTTEADKDPSPTDEPHGADTNPAPPKSDEKKGNSGCLILFLLGMPVIDAIGVIMPVAGPYSQVVGMSSLCGFVCGAVAGAYWYGRIKKQHWWASCWWAIWGLLGMLLFTAISVCISIALLQMQ